MWKNGMWKNGAGVMMESATVSAVVFPSIVRRVIGKEHPAPASAVLNKHFRHPA